MFGLHYSDIIMILAYFGAMLFIGYRAMKNIKNQEDFFLGGRRFGKWIQTFAAFGQGTSAESAVVTTSVVNTNGASAIWGMIAGGLFSLPIFWMTSVWYRRMRFLTLADFFEERFGSKAMAVFYSVMQALFFMIVAALGFSAMSKTVAGIAVKDQAVLTVQEKAEYQRALELDELESLDFELLTEQQQSNLKQLRLEKPQKQFSHINENVLIIIIAVFVLVYASAGGLEAAFVTDMIQGIFIIILSLILFPFGLAKIYALGGATGILAPFKIMHQRLPEAFFEIWGSPNVIEFTWHWIAAFGLMGIFNVAIQANQLTANGSAKDEYTARFGFVSGILIKRYTTVLWGFVGLITLVLYSGVVRDPDYIWGYATRDLLGPFGLGLVGLMIACLMAALMSTADCLMITSSSLLTNNAYRPMFPGKSETHYVWAGRIFSAVYIIGGILIATQFKTVFSMLKLIAMFNCILAASFWLGILWRRTTRAGAWASMITTFAFTILLPVVIPMLPGIKTNEYLLKTTHPEPIVRKYIARQMDLENRQSDIEKWDRFNEAGKAEGTRPEPLEKGQKFEKTYVLPDKSIFWSEGLEVTDNGQTRGCGMLKVELVAIDFCGFDLSNNSYSMNETIAVICRIIVPFFAVVFVSFLTKPDDKKRLDRFFVMMKTPAHDDRKEDERQMALSYEDPARFDHNKLFPKSNWEFQKWDRTDFLGVMWILGGIAGCIGLLVFLVTLGSS